MIAMGELLTGAWVSQGIATIAQLGVADHMAGGHAAVSELARAVNANEDALYRVLRMLVPAGVVRETSPRHFALTEIGALLRSDHPNSMRAFAAYNGDPWHWRMWGELGQAVRSGKPVSADDSGAPLFEYLAAHPDEAATFDAAMADLSNARDVSAISGFDFSQFKTIVDVGGGEGMLVRSVLKSFPNVSGILYDLPAVIERARAQVERDGLAQRCALVAGSFFDSVPRGGDAYMLKQVLHDWPDADAVKILRNCREQLGGDGKVLIFEMVVPENSAADISKLSDLEMLIITGGRERTLREYQQLLSAAGLRFVRLHATRSPFSIVEASPDQIA